MDILSQSQSNFFFNRPIFFDYPHMKEAFTNNSQEILQFLDEEDINNLKCANKFFCDICECHLLFSQTMKQLSNLFSISVNVDTQEPPQKKSKFKEKYNFNKPIGVYYKPPEKYTKTINKINRIQSAKVRNRYNNINDTKLNFKK